MQNGLLIKYGEIAIKGNNRHQFENLLIRNIRDKIASVGSYRISKEQGRLLIESEGDECPISSVIEPLKKVFGIIGICPASVFTDDSLGVNLQPYGGISERNLWRASGSSHVQGGRAQSE